MASLVICLLCLGFQIAAQFPKISGHNENDTDEGLIHFLHKLRQDEFYDTLLVYGEDCVFHDLIRHLDVPTVLVSSGSTSFDWHFSSLTMILCCGPESERETTYRTLLKLQRSRRLIYLQEKVEPRNVCNSYAKKEQYNIAMLQRDFGKFRVIYTCRFFQEPNYEELNLSDTRPIYIEQFQNMHGKPISAKADLLPPRSMPYRDANSGEMKLMGYVANLINNFAEKVNATLQYGYLAGNESPKDISKRARLDQIDVGVTLETSLYEKNVETASDPYLLTSYCLMVPVPEKLPYNLVYAAIVDPLVLGIIFLLFCLLSMLLIYSRRKTLKDLSLANILLNDMCLRGLLGQSFPFPSNANKHLRLIFCILCFASILISTMYEAYLQSFFTDPPSGPHIHSFKEFGKFHQKIGITEIENSLLINLNNTQFLEIHKDDLRIFYDWQEYLELRNAFNRDYSFLVTWDRWSAYAEQQKLFKEPLFYFAKDLCFSHLIFLSFPMRRHLPYRHLFNDHMMRQHEFGLVNYWKSHSFFDMVRLGITPLEDLSRPITASPSLLMEDISWILKLYLAAILLSILCFLLEIGIENSRAQLSDIEVKKNIELENGLINLLQRLRLEEPHETLLVYGEDCVFHSLSKRLHEPKVLVSTGSTNFDWNFNSRALILSCGPQDDREANYRTLIKLQRSRRLIYITQADQPSAVCEQYSQKEQYNVAMVREDFDISRMVYACRSTQDPSLQEVDTNTSEPIYIEQFQNMHGKPIRAMTDLVAPRAMLDGRSGKIKLTGYLADSINYYVLKTNATLQYEIFKQNYGEITKGVDEGELDIGISLVNSMFSDGGWDTTSYPFVLTPYCLMLQIPSQLPINITYAVVMDSQVLILIFVMFCLLSVLLLLSEKLSWRSLKISSILLNDVTLRGILGQSHPFPANASKTLRLIFCILCFASIMLTTMYCGTLNSFLMDPPNAAPIRSFKDIRKYNKKLAISEYEANAMIKSNNTEFMEMAKDDLEIFLDLREFVKIRDRLSLSYGYMQTGDRWTSVDEHQRIFKKPVYYFAKDLCFSRLLFLSIPMRRHLPYRHLLEDHLRRQHEFGLVGLWMDHAFMVKVKVGITQLTDISPPPRKKVALVMEDLAWLLKNHMVRQHEFGLVIRSGLTPIKDLSPPTVHDASLLLQDVSWVLKISGGAGGN
ncbi:uncharacterized protein [Drosophila takahashii]|uniref:uncharacterized protein n=1 Tax=Drosophila takahashii TaxID=29030 RepID=UPI001CF8BE44|nr:uncharacterized protein LOC108054368 [Drosophila takahashii]